MGLLKINIVIYIFCINNDTKNLKRNRKKFKNFHMPKLNQFLFHIPLFVDSALF